MYIVIISAEQQVFVTELNTLANLDFRGYFIMKRSMDVHCLYNTFLKMVLLTTSTINL